MPTVSIEQALALAIDHHKAGRRAEAESIYGQILAVQPDHPGALHLQGLLAADARNFPAAEQLIRRAIAILPTEPLYPTNLGRLLMQLRRPAEAVTLLRQSLALAPNDPEVWFDLAIALENIRQSQDAESAYRRALALDPAHAGSWCNLATILRNAGRFDESLACCENALRARPNMVEALVGIGLVHEARGEYAAALECYQRALPHGANYAGLHYNMGVALAALGRATDAEAAYRRTLALDPDHYGAHNNLGGILKFAGQPDAALEHYRHAHRLMPHLPHAIANLAEVAVSTGRFDEGLAAYRRAAKLAPMRADVHSAVLYTLLFDPHTTAVALRDAHTEWNQRHVAPLAHLIRPHTNDRSPVRKLRIGYVSANFFDHVVARNLLPLFREHDRAQFEIVCYSNNRLRDAVTDRIMPLATTYRQVEQISDDAFADLIRADHIDILVDLSLHMNGNRLLTFARKPAPVQVTFAGYPGSTGMTAIDYRLTDRHLDPPSPSGAEIDALYSEKSIRLDSFWCYEPLEDVPVNVLPADAASNNQVTFGCLNNFCKITDSTIALWCKALAAVPHSRLVILVSQGQHRDLTLALFERQGISHTRIDFLPPCSRVEYLAYYHRLDICLDTLPYNGHTTSLDALHMGVPVITLVGDRIVGLAGLSQLTNADLPELIARSPDEFVSIAASLAVDLPRLRQLRQTLRQRLQSSLLMDAKRFTRNIESVYRTMWQTWCSNPA
jgi:predicted O-linked N-acetylglucosamine transferase (SPINDLY family)